MPRYRRPFLPDIPLHIVQRGHDRQPVFAEPNDFMFYIANMIEAKSKYDVRVHAYCLMTNHVHLLVTPGMRAGMVCRPGAYRWSSYRHNAGEGYTGSQRFRDALAKCSGRRLSTAGPGRPKLPTK